MWEKKTNTTSPPLPSVMQQRREPSRQIPILNILFRQRSCCGRLKIHCILLATRHSAVAPCKIFVAPYATLEPNFRDTHLYASTERLKQTARFLVRCQLGCSKIYSDIFCWSAKYLSIICALYQTLRPFNRFRSICTQT